MCGVPRCWAETGSRLGSATPLADRLRVDLDASFELFDGDPFIAGVGMGDVAGATDQQLHQSGEFTSIGTVTSRLRLRTDKPTHCLDARRLRIDPNRLSFLAGLPLQAEFV